MMDINKRIELNNKYAKLPLSKDEKDKNELKIYMDYINVLNDLLDEIKTLRKENQCFLLKGFNPRQIGCIDRITKTDNGWNTEIQKFNQRYYEMMDFIYCPGGDYGPSLTQEELSMIELMINYLTNLAKKKIGMEMK